MVVDVIVLVGLPIGAAPGGLITGNLFCRLLRRCWLGGGRPSLLLALLGAPVSMIYVWTSGASFLSNFVFSTVVEAWCKPVNLPVVYSADPPLDDSILELPIVIIIVSSPPVITVESAPPPPPVTTVSLPWLLPPELLFLFAYSPSKAEGVGAVCIALVFSGSDYFSLLFPRRSKVVGPLPPLL